LLAAIPASAFGACLLPLLLQRFGRRAAALAAAMVMMSCLACVLPLAPAAFTGSTQFARLSWLPAYGLDLSLRLDGLGLLFCLLILGIGLLVVLYAAWYLPASDRLGRFYSILLLFMAAMLGVVLSENVILLLVFWEITSLSSFLLVAYRSDKFESRHRCPLLLGAFTKSAQWPFHFWLPNAMAAPTPVSAYLHSATMVKAGVFLLARLYPALAGSDTWFWIVGGTGLATFVFGAWAAVFRTISRACWPTRRSATSD
jgi:multicomponent K+:H+ antiporter subunit A